MIPVHRFYGNVSLTAIRDKEDAVKPAFLIRSTAGQSYIAIITGFHEPTADDTVDMSYIGSTIVNNAISEDIVILQITVACGTPENAARLCDAIKKHDKELSTPLPDISALQIVSS